MSMNQVEHPIGCQCDACLDEEGEEQQPLVQPPPKRPRGRPRNPQPQQQPQPQRSGGVTYTSQVESPQHMHARYEYESGEMRRCHICAYSQSMDAAMMYSDEPTWFASLEDRARHILEVHTDASDPIIKLERQRAKEILGIKDLWDYKSPNQPVQIGKPIMDNSPYAPQQAPKKPMFSFGGPKRPKVQGQGNWFSNHKIITVLLVGGIIYVVIMLYMLSQGYEF